MFIVCAFVNGVHVESNIEVWINQVGDNTHEQHVYRYWEAARGFLQKNTEAKECDIYAIHSVIFDKDCDGYDDYNKPIGRETVWEKKGIDVFINAYQIVQSYGGPEEGGWWYDCWEPMEEWCVNIKSNTTPVEDLNDKFSYLVKATKEDIENSVGPHRPSSSAAGGFDVSVRVELKTAEPGNSHSPWC